MPIYFLDSSALVKAYRQEAGTEFVIALLDGVDRLAISRLAQVEVSAAIVRRGRGANVVETEISRSLAQLDREIAAIFQVVEITPEIMARANVLTRARSLRGADAIQLASAMAVRDLNPASQAILVACDAELNNAARLEGLAVLDPVQP